MSEAESSRQIETALVTGASYGIGRAVATALSRRGYGLVLTARSAERLAAVADELGTDDAPVECIAGDIASGDDRARLLERVAGMPSGLKLVVHCASAVPNPELEAELSTTSDARIAESMATTAGAFQLLKGLQPTLALAAPSNAVLLASDWALQGSHGPPVHSASKAAVLHFARTARHEFARSGCSLSTIIPGDVATYDAEWTSPLWTLDDPVDEVRKQLGEERIPLIDVVEAVLFAVDRRMARVEEVHLSPLRPDYDY